MHVLTRLLCTESDERLRQTCFRREGPVLREDRGRGGCFDQLVPSVHQASSMHALAVPQPLNLALRRCQSCLHLTRRFSVKLNFHALVCVLSMRCPSANLTARFTGRFRGFQST